MSDDHPDAPVYPVSEPEHEAPAPAPVQEPEPAAAPSAPVHPTALIVDEWVRDHLHGSILGRSTEAWNHVQSVLPALKTALAKKL